MKHLLALIAICLPLYLFAQGFGSFSHDQPFFARDDGLISDPSLYLLYDANLLGLSDGDLVSSFTDQGIHKYDALSTGTGRPYWTNNVSEINGEGYLYFDGDNDYMNTNASFYKYPPYHIFSVAKLLDPVEPINHCILGDPFGSNWAWITFNGTNIVSENGYVNRALPASQTNWVVWEMCFNGASSYVRTNNVLYKTGTTGTNRALYSVAFGSTIEAANMGMAYTEVHTNVVSESDAEAIVAGLGTRYGITIGTRDAISTWNPTTNGPVLSIYDSATQPQNAYLMSYITKWNDQGPYRYDLNNVGSTDVAIRAYPFEFEGDQNVALNWTSGTSGLRTNYTTSYPQPCTVIAVCYTPNTSGLQYIHGTGENMATYQIGYHNANNTMSAGVNFFPYNQSFQRRWIYEWYYNGANSVFRTNNVATAAAGNTGTHPRAGLSLTVEGPTLIGKSKVQFWWFGIYTNTLSATERSNVYYYLGKRYNIPVTFP